MNMLNKIKDRIKNDHVRSNIIVILIVHKIEENRLRLDII